MITAILIFLIVASVYLGLILPRLIDRPSMDGLVDDYAHRGLHNELYPENSLGAFKNAVEHQVGIELDIQLSSDKIPMVFHDDNLKRVCGIDAKLSSYTADELSKMSLLGSKYTIPTLKEVLELVDGRVPLLVEFKHGSTELCEIACDMLDGYHGSFCVESFDPILLMRIKKYRPKYVRGQLVTNMFKTDFSKNPFLNFGLTFMLFNFLSRPDFIAFDKTMKGNASVWICDKVIRSPMFIWTVTTEREYDESKRLSRVPIFERFIP